MTMSDTGRRCQIVMLIELNFSYHNEERRKGRIESTEPPAGWQNTDHIGITVLFGAGFSRPGILAGPN